jgi:hypothetical protein
MVSHAPALRGGAFGNVASAKALDALPGPCYQ